MEVLRIVQAHEHFYRSVDQVVDRGEEYRPSVVAPGWLEHNEDVWRMWQPPGGRPVPEEGWKIHVSARVDRAPLVLDLVATVLFDEGVAFKHLSCTRFFQLVHHKHAARVQAGKFCAVYPSDVSAAQRILDRLTSALAGEEGPSVLTDRRYRDSSTVYYRYGGFVARPRVRLDGGVEWLVRDSAGQDVPDRRLSRFLPPDGITDPFMDESRASDYEPLPAAFTPVLCGYRIDRAIASSNSGGAYAATEVATGRSVFVKEARFHNGLTSSHRDAQTRLHHEAQVLRQIHDRDPGACPEPFDRFRFWTGEYLVTELVAGVSLHAWNVSNNPIIWPDASPADFAAYYARCEAVLDSVAAAIARVHACGYAFVDLSAANVLVDDDDSVRLIDFEAAVALDDHSQQEVLGTPGYAPPARTVFTDRRDLDGFGLSMLALALIAPINDAFQRNPAALAHLRAEIERRAAVPERLFATAARFHRAAVCDFRRTPAPAEVVAPGRALDRLHDGLVAGILAVTDAGARDVTALGPGRFATNELCVANGLAGVVHALHRSGVPVSDRIVDRLANDAMGQATGLAPGLHTGLAGIAWVLAEVGLVAEAAKLLETAEDHRLLSDGGPEAATLGYGRAGLGLAQLNLYHRTGDDAHLDAAVNHARAIPPEHVTAELGPHGANGLLHGPSGVALFLYYLARVTGDDTHVDRGLALLHSDVGRLRFEQGGLLLPASDRDQRLMPYLDRGTAGLVLVASRYAALCADDRITATLPTMLASITCSLTVYAGLSAGMAGLGLALADHGRRHGDAATMEQATSMARRLFIHAVPHEGAQHILGEHALRFSTDLSFGSAGVVVFLDYLRHGRPDPFFTLDAFDQREGGDHR